MEHDQDLQKQLRRPAPPAELKSKVLRNWAQQLDAPQTRYLAFDVGVVTTCVVVLAVIVAAVIRLNATPSVVIAALADIEKDKPLNIGLSLPKDAWQGWHKIDQLPMGMALKMTKYCVLEGNRTIHLSFAGQRRGEVHVFINQEKYKTLFWQKTDGKHNAMPWRLLKPTTEQSVLVLYSPDMDVKNAEKLINKLFYA